MVCVRPSPAQILVRVVATAPSPVVVIQYRRFRAAAGIHSGTSSNASNGSFDGPETATGLEPSVAVSGIMGSVQMALGAGLGATGGAAMSRQNAGERLFSLPRGHFSLLVTPR